MGARWMLRAAFAAVAAMLLLAPAAHADTCCANTAVGLEPGSAAPGSTVRVSGLRCLAFDNTGPLALKLDAFWLSAGSRAPEPHPDVAPALGLPADLPPTDQWHPFASVTPAADGTGSATILIPSLAAGAYQLWWTCDEGGGPGSGIHYSAGPRLSVIAAPDTATDSGGSLSGDSSIVLALLLAAGFGLSVSILVLAATTRDDAPGFEGVAPRDGGGRTLEEDT